MTDITDLSARDIAGQVRRAKLSAGGVADAFLERIAAVDGPIEAWEHLDADAVRRQAAVSDEGPLAGVPVAVKDVFDTADAPTTYGSPIYAGHRPAADAACVARLRAAGAVILGKTVSTEFAYWKPGKTRNPLSPDRSPGGSSSGSAAAVAARMAPAALGTQTAASLIRPASYCGVVAFKPSYAQISVVGVKALAGSLDTVGVLARSVADGALVAGVMAERPGWPQAAGQPRRPRVGVCRSLGSARPDRAGERAVQVAAERLAEAGATVIEAEPPWSFDALTEAQTTVMAVEAARDLAAEWLGHREALSPQLCELLSEGERHGGRVRDEALRLAARYADELAAADLGVDVLLSPGAPGEAPRLEEGTGDPVFSRGWTLLGLPAVGLPCGLGPCGLPVGVQVVAPRKDDAALLSHAAWIEAALADLPRTS